MSLPEPSILVAAASGRALAGAARRSGFRPLVADFFDDLDTRALCPANVTAGGIEQGFEACVLVERLQALAADEAPVGVVYGGGFEDRPEIIDALARHFRVYGNCSGVVAQAKDPRRLAKACCDLGIPHPEIGFDAPPDADRWLIKRQGGGGGLSIAPASSRKPGPLDYYQRRVRGRPVSVLLLADGQRAQTLGTSAQWATPDTSRPFRFGGAVRPADVDLPIQQAICRAAERLAEAFALAGLNSVDFLVAEDTFHAIEINPRPGATLDIFAHPRLFAAHLDACGGHLPNAPLIFTRAGATAIAYAPCDVAHMPELDWPGWCADRQKPGTRLAAGDPVCTVSAEAEEPGTARKMVGERVAAIRSYLTSFGSEESAA